MNVRDKNKVHFLKTLNPYYGDIEDGSKCFDIRKNDRKFRLGDYLILREFIPRIGPGIPAKPAGRYTGAEIIKRISYIFPGGQFGVKEGHCVLGLRDLGPYEEIE